MSLESYCHDRLVVVGPHASVFAAAHAMASNAIGAVLVSQRGRLVGILTDRDLAMRSVARDLLPSTVEVAELMTPDPVTIDISETEERAAELMQVMHVRRLVVLDRGHIAGLVTLDDLVLSRQATFDEVRDVVYAQLADEAPSKPGGFTRPMRRQRDPLRWEHRRSARRQQTLGRFLTRIAQITGLADRDRARAAFEVVASGVARRLTPQEAEDFAAQLPADLQQKVLEQARGPDRRITRQSIENEMSARLDVSRDRAAELVTALGAAMGELVTTGELEDMVSQLPKPMQELLGGR